MAEEAYGRLQVMAVKQSMTSSLITSHEPNGDILNTDGNGGIPQIINTMLLFSRPGQIDLLPALPKDWPSGKVTGLRARGNFTVDIEWKEGKVTNYHVTSPEPKEVRIRVNGEIRTIFCEKKESTPIPPRTVPALVLSTDLIQD
jgi:alpha-L-fucosidase 2